MGMNARLSKIWLAVSAGLILTVSLSSGAGTESWKLISYNMDPDSIVSRAQIESLYSVVMQEIEAQNSNETSLTHLNVKLKELRLPEVDLHSSSISLSVSYLVGFSGSTPVGIEIRD